MKVYFDNAATTPIDPQVIDVMQQVMKEEYGNPSSIHAPGRKARSIIETSRRTISNIFNVSPGEIFFTSGGTEADNMAIWQTVMDLGIEHIITSEIEHHAVLHTVEELEKRGKIQLHFVDIDEKGHIDLNHLERLTGKYSNTLVTLMHANNEIGNLLPIEKVGEICNSNNVIFHSDTVQTIGHYKMNLAELPVDIINCSGHKFHGPKGVGFIYINSDIQVKPLIYGGAQERNMRGGTENIYGIAGLAKALELAINKVEEHHKHIQSLKTNMIDALEKNIPGVCFNGDVKGNSLYTVLNVCLPPTDKAEMLLYLLDMHGIACSAGSACSSGTNIGSHVLRAIGSDMERPSLRFSFSKFNTQQEVDYVIKVLKDIFN